MITGSEIYWITRLDGLKDIMEVVGITGLLLAATASVIYILCSLTDDAEWEDMKRAVKGMALAFCCFALVAISSVFVPTTKEYCAIKYVPQILNNEDVREIPQKAVGLVNEWLDEMRPNGVEL